MNYFLIGLGSNIEPEVHMPAAIKALQNVGHLITQSEILVNPPCGQGFDGLFHNQLLVLSTPLTAAELKPQLEQIEIALGREPKTPQRKFNNRTIDIDILNQQASAQQCLNVELKDSYNQTIMDSWAPAIQ